MSKNRRNAPPARPSAAKAPSPAPPPPRTPAEGGARGGRGRLVAAVAVLVGLAAAGYWGWRRVGPRGQAQGERPAADFAAPAASGGVAYFVPTAAPYDLASTDLAVHCRDIDGHFYLGEAKQRQLEEQVAQAGRAIEQGAGADTRGRLLSLQAELGRSYQQHGAYELALAQFDGALRLLADAPPPTAEPSLSGGNLPSPDPLSAGVLRLRKAATYLRMAESANCSVASSPTMCLVFETTAEGAYRRPDEVKLAMALLEENLAADAGDVASRWLLNIAHMLLRTYPRGVPPQWLIPPERFESAHDAPRFRNIAPDLGLDTVNMLGGSLMEDLDEDGLLDMVTTTFDPCQHLNYYRSDGNGGFEARAVEAGLGTQLGGFNLQQTDYDNDGHLDLFITRGGWQLDSGKMRVSLVKSNGDGTFTDVTKEAGLAEVIYPTQASAWADYDLDGDLDLYIGNEMSDEQRPYPSQLFENHGDGTFTDVAEQAGVRNDIMAKSVAWGDYDNDGDPDLYVSNIGPNRLYRNDGDGTFTDVAADLGVNQPIERSFVAWFWDYDNDGWLDIWVGGYGARLPDIARSYMGDTTGPGVRPRLYHNDGAGGFKDVTAEAGLDIVRIPMGANFGDIDNDGFLDMYLGTGDPELTSLTPNEMFWNDGGRRFLNVTAAAGVGHLPKGHGIAFGDLDNDGDQDLLLQAGGFGRGDASPNALFQNPGTAGHHWLTLKLRGVKANRAAIGARIRVRASGPDGERDVHLVVDSGGSFGASSLQSEIGLGTADTVEAVEVRWPGGATQTFTGLEVDRFYALEEGAARAEPLNRTALRLGGGAP